jgi:hypothetical protein
MTPDGDWLPGCGLFAVLNWRLSRVPRPERKQHEAGGCGGGFFRQKTHRRIFLKKLLNRFRAPPISFLVEARMPKPVRSNTEFKPARLWHGRRI